MVQCEVVGPFNADKRVPILIEWKGERVGVFETRRHYTNYFKGIPNFKEYRQRMVTHDAAADVYAVLDEVLDKFGSLTY